MIGEAGERLSAGERARLGPARALLSPAPPLLVDWPTAHLDPASATAVLDLPRGRTARSSWSPTTSPASTGAGARR